MENEVRHEDIHYPHHHGWPALRIVGLVMAGVVAAAVFSLLFGWLVFLLWNWLMPALFGFKTITFWQAFGILLLSKLVFSGFSGPHHRGGHGWHHDPRPWHHHRWHKERGGEEGRLREAREGWRYYDQFWREEGKSAFEAYLEKMRQKKQD